MKRESNNPMESTVKKPALAGKTLAKASPS
jgi:hypothetical protein